MQAINFEVNILIKTVWAGFLKRFRPETYAYSFSLYIAVSTVSRLVALHESGQFTLYKQFTPSESMFSSNMQ